MKVTTGAVESLLQDNLPESNGLQVVATDHCPLLIPPGWFFSSFAFPRKLQQNQTETLRLLGAYNYWNKGKSIASDLPWPRIQRFLISAGSMRWYLQLIQVAQGTQLLQDIKSINPYMSSHVSLCYLDMCLLHSLKTVKDQLNTAAGVVSASLCKEEQEDRG